MRRMVRAIDEYQIVGIETTLEFCRFVMQHEAFTSGQFDTHFVQNHFQPEMLKQELTTDEAMLVSMIAVKALNGQQLIADNAHPREPISAWRINRGR
jgi:acetyl-CoA carboxylase biotin carboxylase subunit